MRRSTAGFTLLEITIVMAIFAIIATILYGVFARTLETKLHAETAADRASLARMVLARITHDLQAARVARSLQVARQRPAAPAPGGMPTPGATPLPSTLFWSRNHAEGGAPFDDVAFTAFARRPTAVTFSGVDLTVLRYYVAPLHPQAPDLGLYREAVYSLSGDTFDPDVPNPLNSTLVLERVRGLEFRFFDGADWVQEWDSSDPKSTAAAPLAVEITLSVAEESGDVETYRTSIDLPGARPLAGGTPRPDDDE